MAQTITERVGGIHFSAAGMAPLRRSNSQRSYFLRLDCRLARMTSSAPPTSTATLTVLAGSSSGTGGGPHNARENPVTNIKHATTFASLIRGASYFLRPRITSSAPATSIPTLTMFPGSSSGTGTNAWSPDEKAITNVNAPNNLTSLNRVPLGTKFTQTQAYHSSY
jgi:hypothetical protein